MSDSNYSFEPLQAMEEQVFYGRISELAQLGSFSWNLQSNELRWCDQLFRIYGLTREHFTPTVENFMELVVPDDRQLILASIQNAIKTCSEFEHQERILHSSGEIRTLHSQGTVLQNSDGQPTYVVGACRDITEFVRARGELQWQIDGLKLLANASGELLAEQRDVASQHQILSKVAQHLGCDMFVSLRVDGTELFVETCSGFSATFMEKYLRDLEHTVCGESALGGVFIYLDAEQLAGDHRTQELYKEGVKVVACVPLLGSEQSIGTISFASTSRSSFDGAELDFLRTLSRVAAAAQARALSDEKLRRSEARFRTLVNFAQDAFFLYESSGRVLDVNPAACSMLGYTMSELLGTCIASVDLAMTGEARMRIMSQMDRGESLATESVFVRKDGTKFPVEVHATRVPVSESACYLAIARDVSSRKAAELELQRSEQRYRLAIEQARMVVWEMNPTTEEFAYISDLSQNILGIPAKELRCPAQLNELIHPDDVSRVQHEKQVSLDEQRDYQIEFRLNRPDSSTIWIEEVAKIEVVNGVSKAVRGVMSDITHRKQLEDRYLQSQKMEALGTLAGGIAHDFNNLLAVINSWCDLLHIESLKQNKTHTPSDAVEALRDAVGRGSKLTSQLLMVAKSSSTELCDVDINSVVLSLQNLLGPMLGDHITLVLNLHGSLPQIRADESHIQQGLLNLIFNARHAMQEGGQLTIATSFCHSNQINPKTSSGIQSLSGNYVCLSVSDTGEGIEDAVMARIFEPFFTTKPTGQGTGLGLSVVYGLMKSWGGFIDAESQAGVGTTFRMYFPVNTQTAPAIDNSLSMASEVQAIPQLDSATCRPRGSLDSKLLLVVDDDPGVRRVASLGLESFGYRVLEAESGSAALKLLSADISLIVTDVIMPGMDGPELARRAREIHSKIPVVYISGFNESRLSAVQGEPVLQKPFSLSSLQTLVAEALKE